MKPRVFRIRRKVSPCVSQPEYGNKHRNRLLILSVYIVVGGFSFGVDCHLRSLSKSRALARLSRVSHPFSCFRTGTDSTNRAKTGCDRPEKRPQKQSERASDS